MKRILFAFFSLLATNGLTAQVNNAIANAIEIKSDSTCELGTSLLNSQTLANATYNASDIGSISSACNFVASQDVWYWFTAKSTAPTISVYNLGSSWNGSLKLSLYSGNPGSLTSQLCENNNPITPVPSDINLSINAIYYIRVHKDNTTAPTGSNWGFSICVTDNVTKVSRMNEVFSRTYLAGAGDLQFPWEIIYGPDNNLWITESKGYKVYKMNPTTGAKTTILDISQNSTFLPLADRSFNCQFANGNGAQGGLAGMALHPNFLDGTANEDNSVYISYIYSSDGGSAPTGQFYTNRLVKFTYNKVSGLMESPVLIIGSLPGSSDHNSQRMIIAPVSSAAGAPKYLFYAQGDMGAGQFGNRDRTNNAQNSTVYEGKILRFNLQSDGDAGVNAWIPNSNPYGATNAVYSIGIRNNQGFAYDATANLLYGSSHGPYSDDEINIIEPAKNYGHPFVIGYAADGNYNGTTTPSTNTSVSAGAAFTDNSGNSACQAIGNETTRKNAINTASADSYRDPIFSAYPTPSAGTNGIANIWKTNPSNGGWESEGWSGLDLYTNKVIPGWKKSLVAAGLKWGRLIRLPLGVNGTTTLPSNIGSAVGNAGDTITYFQSTNRYRDLAFAPNGKDIFLVMDNNSATSGPGTANPSAPGCPGCVVKYTFLGYADNGSGQSTIPQSIDVTKGTLNTCNSGTPVTIDNTNNTTWVPITGPDGNIMAEINAMGQNLGLITSSFYQKASGAIRVRGGVHYMDRNITITPANNSFATPVKIRLYISKQEFDDLRNDGASGVTSLANLRIHKNNDACLSAIGSNTSVLTAGSTVSAAHGTNGYVIQNNNITGFSSFYFAGNLAVVPVTLVSFTGSLQNDLSALLNWKTETEINLSGFDLERSSDGNKFTKITSVIPQGNNSGSFDYAYKDKEAFDQQSAVLYYRLKTINSDGTTKYSEIVKINFPVAKALITIAPNPASDDLKGNIISPVTGNVTIRIFDNAGRVVLQKNSFIKKGSNKFTEDINQLASGAYYLDISGSGIVSRVKFQKM